MCVCVCVCVCGTDEILNLAMLIFSKNICSEIALFSELEHLKCIALIKLSKDLPVFLSQDNIPV